MPSLPSFRFEPILDQSKFIDFQRIKVRTVTAPKPHTIDATFEP